MMVVSSGRQCLGLCGYEQGGGRQWMSHGRLLSIGEEEGCRQRSDGDVSVGSDGDEWLGNNTGCTGGGRQVALTVMGRL